MAVREAIMDKPTMTDKWTTVHPKSSAWNRYWTVNSSARVDRRTSGDGTAKPAVTSRHATGVTARHAAAVTRRHATAEASAAMPATSTAVATTTSAVLRQSHRRGAEQYGSTSGSNEYS
jgi:hypothetical protein